MSVFKTDEKEKEKEQDPRAPEAELRASSNNWVLKNEVVH